MSRPAKPVTQIIVKIDRDYLVWTDGFLSGSNKELIDKAKKLSDLEIAIDLTPYGPTIPANLNIITNPEQAVAAMLGAGAGRGFLIKAPREVLDLLPLEDDDETEDPDDSSNPVE